MRKIVINIALKPLEFIPVELIGEVVFQLGVAAIAVGAGAAVLLAVLM